jgi:ATP-binding cassette subfamily C protein CydD/ATP-binding cassette subfamily C protein CydCD
VYLLDEPDANLDAEGVGWVATLVCELASAGKIVVVAAHTPEIVAVADRVVRLSAGRVVSIDERPRRVAAGRGW